jgi:hypothetical protein
LKVNIAVPSDTELKPTNGFIRIKAVGTQQDLNSSVSVVKGARLGVNLNTTDQDFVELLVRAIDIADVNGGDPIKSVLKVENKGNIAAGPDLVTLEIQNLNQQPITTLEDNTIDTIEPGETSEVTAEFIGSIEIGEYFGVVKVYYQGTLLREETLVFNVLEAIETVTPSQEEVGDPNILNYILIAILTVAVVAFLIILFLYKKRKKSDDEGDGSKSKVEEPSPDNKNPEVEPEGIMNLLVKKDTEENDLNSIVKEDFNSLDNVSENPGIPSLGKSTRVIDQTDDSAALDSNMSAMSQAPAMNMETKTLESSPPESTNAPAPMEEVIDTQIGANLSEMSQMPASSNNAVADTSTEGTLQPESSPVDTIPETSPFSSNTEPESPTDPLTSPIAEQAMPNSNLEEASVEVPVKDPLGLGNKTEIQNQELSNSALPGSTETVPNEKLNQ